MFYWVRAFRRSSVVERAAVNRLVVGSNPTAGATLTLKLAGFGRPGQVLAARIGPKMTLKMTLSQSSLENLYRLTLLRRADVAVDLHRGLARRVTQQFLGDARMDASTDQ